MWWLMTSMKWHDSLIIWHYITWKFSYFCLRSLIDFILLMTFFLALNFSIRWRLVKSLTFGVVCIQGVYRSAKTITLVSCFYDQSLFLLRWWSMTSRKDMMICLIWHCIIWKSWFEVCWRTLIEFILLMTFFLFFH